MPDVQGKLDEIITMVETAKEKALSGSAAVIDRAALLGALEELRQLLPAEMSEARSLLRERAAVQDEARAQADELLGQARAEADRTVAAAHQERARLVSESELVEEAERVAADITEDAETQAIQMRLQTDDYVDASLARFEQLLTASLETVSRGRSRVATARADAAASIGHAAEEHTGQAAFQGLEDDAAGAQAGASSNAPQSPANGHYESSEGLSWDSGDQQDTRTPSVG